MKEYLEGILKREEEHFKNASPYIDKEYYEGRVEILKEILEEENK